MTINNFSSLLVTSSRETTESVISHWPYYIKTDYNSQVFEMFCQQFNNSQRQGIVELKNFSFLTDKEGGNYIPVHII